MCPKNETDSYDTIHHQTISSIRGIRRSPTIRQYLGVQYATLKDRFSRGTLLGSYPHASGVLDATKIGPIPLSPSNGCEWEQKLIQQSLPFSDLQQSDTECLTLNITVPERSEPEGTPIPVLALVHGGAFATGSSSYPQYDLERIVQMSVEMGTPIVAVGINYRLGIPGFLHSSAMKSAGYKPNNGLDDQRLGLLWIQKHIAGFGGDPNRVTYIGESSGAAAGCFHLHSADPLFDRLISMSGTSLLHPKRPAVLERSFERAVEILGFQDLSPPDQVLKLRDAPLEDLREKIGRKIPLGPMLDGEMIPELTTFPTLANAADVPRLFPGIQRCRKIMIGDCQMDGNAYATRLASRSDIFPKYLHQCLLKTINPVDPAITPMLVDAYNLDTTATSNSFETTKAVLDFGTDICFAIGTRAFAGAWSECSVSDTEALVYRFNCPNPWDGPWKGFATHIQDIVVVLQNYREFLPAGQQKCGDRFTRDVITFVNGAAPWPAYRSGRKESSMVYDAAEVGEQDGSKVVADEAPDQTGRRNTLSKLSPVVLDRLMDAWEMFMKGQ